MTTLLNFVNAPPTMMLYFAAVPPGTTAMVFTTHPVMPILAVVSGATIGLNVVSSVPSLLIRARRLTFTPL
jgi:hypothetical protein